MQLANALTSPGRSGAGRHDCRRLLGALQSRPAQAREAVSERAGRTVGRYEYAVRSSFRERRYETR